MTSDSTIGPFAALEHVFQIECADDTARTRLEAIFSPLRTDRSHIATYTIADASTPGFVDVSLDGERIAHVDDLRVAEEHLIWTVNRRAVDSWPTVLLHGGAVQAPDGTGVLVVGRSGAGKSTLVTSLIRAGFGYLSDELIPLESDGMVRAHPRAISLKHGSWGTFPESAHHSVEVSSGGGLGQRHLDPQRLGATIVPWTKPGLVVLLDRPPEAGQARWDPVATAPAVYELCHHAFNIAGLGSVGLESLRSVVNDATMVTLRGGTPEQRAGTVESLVRDRIRIT